MESEADRAFRDLTARLGDAAPEVLDLILEGKAKGLGEAEVMRSVLELVMGRPELGARLGALVSSELDLPVPAPKPARDEDDEGAWGPMHEATLSERLQFDGDAPELRTGPLPKGIAPAVPVATTARDPVSVGWMLESASEQVAAEARAIEASRVQEVEGLLTDRAEGSTEIGPATLALIERASLPDPEGYARGQLPALRVTEAPEGWALASLTREQRSQLAWRFVSTTQGRRTAVAVIRDAVASGLAAAGLDVEVGGEPGRVPAEDILAHAEWSVDLAGPKATQPNFAFMDVAAAVLLHKLTAASVEGPVRLEVVAVNTVDVRKVGWAARLVRVGGA